MGPILSRHYIALHPAVQREMTLREIHAHLDAVRPLPADENEALMRAHPAVRGRS